MKRDEILRHTPAGDAAGTRTLEEGEQVRVVEWVGDGEWAKVAQAGQTIGYLPRSALLRPKP